MFIGVFFLFVCFRGLGGGIYVVDIYDDFGGGIVSVDFFYGDGIG